jgi:RNA polymerase sigma-70 factor (ECF subfamily)
LPAEKPRPAAPGGATLRAEESRLEPLLRRAASGDRTAFAELYAQTAPQLFGIALRMLRQRDRAEDVLQESFVTIWQRAGDYDPAKGSPMTWLITILRHRAIDALRRGARQPERLAEDEAALLTLVAGPADSAERGSELRALHNCLGELGIEPRRAMLMVYAYGLTQEEFATRSGTPLGTVKSWIRRSLERLKKCLDG